VIIRVCDVLRWNIRTFLHFSKLNKETLSFGKVPIIAEITEQTANASCSDSGFAQSRAPRRDGTARFSARASLPPPCFCSPPSCEYGRNLIRHRHTRTPRLLQEASYECLPGEYRGDSRVKGFQVLGNTRRGMCPHQATLLAAAPPRRATKFQISPIPSPAKPLSAALIR
jgi:hypothetical protein